MLCLNTFCPIWICAMNNAVQMEKRRRHNSCLQVGHKVWINCNLANLHQAVYTFLSINFVPLRGYKLFFQNRYTRARVSTLHIQISNNTNFKMLQCFWNGHSIGFCGVLCASIQWYCCLQQICLFWYLNVFRREAHFDCLLCLFDVSYFTQMINLALYIECS
jgi:hypothetical protein